MSDSRALIEVKNVDKIFGKTKALNNVSAEIKEGEVVVVVGPSGSGKSTFLRCLNLLEEPDKGQIFFEGTDITDPKNNINKHRQKMGMVFQQFNLFPHMTILKNLIIASICKPCRCRKICYGAFGQSRSCRQSRCVSQPVKRRSKTKNSHRQSTVYEARGYAF